MSRPEDTVFVPEFHKLLVVLTVVTIFGMLSPAVHGESGKPLKEIQLVLTPKKAVVRFGESIIAQRELKNVGTRPIALCLSISTQTTYTRLAEQPRRPRSVVGDILPYSGCPGQMIGIMPGESFRDENYLWKAGDEPLTQSGSWEIVEEEAYVYGGQWSGLEASTGVVASNPLIIEIEAAK